MTQLFLLRVPASVHVEARLSIEGEFLTGGSGVNQTGSRWIELSIKWDMGVGSKFLLVRLTKVT